MDREEIIKRFSEQTGHTGFYCENLITGECFGFNADERFAAANVIKLPVFMCIAKWVSEGKADYNEKIKVKNEDKVPGRGALSLFTDEPTADIKTLCNLMISVSDNTAANVLIDLFGIPAFAEEFRSIGLRDTVLGRKFYDNAPKADKPKNCIVLSEIGGLLKKVYDRSFVNAQTSEDIENTLLHQQNNHKLPGHIDDPMIPIAHKTGEMINTSLDVGIVYAVQPFILCFAGNGTNVPAFDDLIRRTAHEICGAYNTLLLPPVFTDTRAAKAAEERSLRHSGGDKRGTPPELLRLVNLQHPLPEDYVPELLPLAGGRMIDRRCRPYLLAMLEDCRAAGGRPLLFSAYRSAEYQKELFEQAVEKRIKAIGMDRRLAMGAAAWYTAPAGTSEHQLGLAADISCIVREAVDFTVRWLLCNAWRYGFILRYPEGRENITGILFESWHYRFVGRDAAEEIQRLGLTLEEYLELYYNLKEIRQMNENTKASDVNDLIAAKEEAKAKRT